MKKKPTIEELLKRIEELEQRPIYPVCTQPHYPCYLPHYPSPQTFPYPNTYPPYISFYGGITTSITTVQNPQPIVFN